MLPAGLVVVAPVRETVDPTPEPIVNVPPVAFNTRFPAKAGRAASSRAVKRNVKEVLRRRVRQVLFMLCSPHIDPRTSLGGEFGTEQK
jgi:hypothetical protein